MCLDWTFVSSLPRVAEQVPIDKRRLWQLLSLSLPDWPMITAAFLAGSLAALAQATIP